MKRRAYFRFNKRGKQEKAKGKRVQKVAPDFGTWWTRHRDAAGRLVRERCEARLEVEAERLAFEKALKSERVAQGLEPAKAEQMAMDALFDSYESAHAHLSSQAPMKSQFKRWMRPHFKRTAASEVTPALCEALLTKARKAGQKPATVRQLHIRGRLVFQYALRLGVVRENPWARVPRPEVPSKRVRFLSREQVAAILEKAGDYRLLIFMAVLTGARRGELAALRWTDWAPHEGSLGMLHFRRSWGRETTKSGKERSVPVHPALRPALEAAKAKATGELVFPSPRTGGLRTESWHTAKLVRSIAKRAGVELPPGTTFHDLRKTFITHLVQDTGGDLGSAQRLAGHSTPQVTATYYLGADAERLAQAVSRLQVVGQTAEHTADTRAAGGTKRALRVVKKD